MKLKKIINHICSECGGEEYVSSCCMSEIYNGKCGSCGKFSKKEVCGYCSGHGIIQYKTNDNLV